MGFFPFYKFKCPSCSAFVECHSRFCGRQAACPSCGKNLVVPEPGGSGGRNTWGNWSKGLIIGIWAIILFLILGWVLRYSSAGL